MAHAHHAEHQLHFAAIWHRVFSLNLEYIVEHAPGDESLDPSLISDDSRCQLGSWLLRQPAEIQALPAYATLVATHAAYHALAGELALRYQAGDREGVEALLGAAYRAASDTVIDQIHALARALGHAGLFGSVGAESERAPRPTIWNTAMEIGVPAIDQRHQAIAMLIDAIADDTLTCDAESGREFLDTLTRFIRMDIAAEERHLQTIGQDMSVLHDHLADHQRILDYIDGMQQATARGEVHALRDVGQFLGNWFVEHLIVHDMDLIQNDLLG